MTSDVNNGLWPASNPVRVQTAPLAADRDVDLAIVGGGFTGCAAALEAARDGATVALLEADTVAHGGSGRNVGLVNAGLWLTPDAVKARLGEVKGLRLLSCLSEGPQRVFELIAREGIDCEATRAGTLHLAHRAGGLRELRERHRQGVALGAPLQLLDAEAVRHRTGSAAFHGALLDPRAGTIQPLAYCMGLAEAAQRAGATIHEHSCVEHIARRADRWHLTANGQTLRAGALLVATNAYHRGLVGVPAPCHATVCFSQFATRPLPERFRAAILPGGEGCWDSALVMTSFRTDRAGRLILGGIGNLQGPGRRIHRFWAMRKVRKIFPDLGQTGIDCQWQGRIAMTSDHVPKVVQFGPDAVSIFGYSGRGIAPGTIFGSAAAQALLHRRPEVLPVEVQPRYVERFTTARSVYYECGASAMHAAAPSGLNW